MVCFAEHENDEHIPSSLRLPDGSWRAAYQWPSNASGQPGDAALILRLADAAKVKTLVVFHHDPSHDDDFMDGIASQLEKTRPGGGVVAKEGMVLRP